MSKRPETALVLRSLIEQRDAGVRLDPWLPFPQRGCCYSFGPHKQPVPIGALFLLWSAGSPYVQPCQACGEPAYMISFSGMLSDGGGSLLCPSCSHSCLHRIGGLLRVRELLATSPLETSAFRPTGMVLSGVIGIDGRVSAHRRVLEILGFRRGDADRDIRVRMSSARPSVSRRRPPPQCVGRGSEKLGSFAGTDPVPQKALARSPATSAAGSDHRRPAFSSGRLDGMNSTECFRAACPAALRSLDVKRRLYLGARTVNHQRYRWLRGEQHSAFARRRPYSQTARQLYP